MKIVKFIVIIGLLLSNSDLFSQTKPVLSKDDIKTAVDSISVKLKRNYIFPEVAEEMAEKIEESFDDGDYTSLTDPMAFSKQITEDLVSVSKDKHIRVIFDPQRIAEEKKVVTEEDSIAFMKRHVERLKKSNFGFKEIKILDGNIGYLDLRGFENPKYGGETAVAAMNFLSNTDAIVIDLRKNGGGSPDMIQLISSYLFDEEPVHLNNFYFRPTDSHSQTWTLPYVPGKRSPKKEVYVLTSSYTFSAAEEFSYNLKNLERATLVGETTGGGAHPGGRAIATDKFMIWLPTGRAINPITKTNWEGVGVKPHIEVDSEKALDVAHIDALEKLTLNNEDEQSNRLYNWYITDLKAKTNPITVDEETLKSFVGVYGPRVVTFEDNRLFYQRGKGTKFELKPLSEDIFKLEGLSYFRVKFVKEGSEIVAIEGQYDNGKVDMNEKDR